MKTALHQRSTTWEMPRRARAWRVLSLLSALALISLLLACAIGSVALTPADLLGAVRDTLHGGTGSLATTLVELRFGRALSAFATGASLALAGVMMQALLRNPLAEPYVLGVSGGAAVGALLLLMLVATAWIVDAAAF